MECEFCKKILSSVSSLNYHKKKYKIVFKYPRKKIR